MSYGAGLTFIAITEAVSRMDGTPFFAFVFFFMLFNLGVSSQFGTLAGLVTPLYNDLKIFGKARKELCVGKCCDYHNKEFQTTVRRQTLMIESLHPP